MGYLVMAFADSEDTGRRVQDALAALEACVAILRRDDWPRVEDDAGRWVSPAELLEASTAEATDPAARQRLTGALADHVEAVRDGVWQRTYEILDSLTSPEHEHELLQAESRGESMSDVRRQDAEDLRRLHPMVFGHGAWHEAGTSWAWNFRVAFPQPVLDELARRCGGRFSAGELQAGVQAVLTPLEELRRITDRELREARRAQWPARSSASPPGPAPGGGPQAGRHRGSSR